MICFSCEKILLQNAITLASRTVSSKSTIPALEGLLLHAETGNGITVSGYNMNTGIRTVVPADVSEEGEIVLNTRLFGDIVRRMPDDIVTVTTETNLMTHLRCGDADFDIPGLSAEDFPELPEVEEEHTVSLPQRTLRSMIEETAFAVSTNEGRPIYTGALFEVDSQLTMVAVDGFRLALRREPLEGHTGGNFTFVAPGAALNEVKNICADTDNKASITLGKNHILFEAGETQLICRRLEGEFLNYRTSIPRNGPIRLKANTRELMDSIDRVSVVITEKTKAPVRCRFDNGRVLLTARTAFGEAKDLCPIDGDGGGLEIGFNNRYLLEALRFAPADTVRMELNTSISPAVLVPEEEGEIGQEKFTYMVLPVRLKA